MLRKFQKRSFTALCLGLVLLSCSKQPSKALPEKAKDANIAKLDKFVVAGLIKKDGSPVANMDLMLVIAMRQGKDLNYTISTDENGYVLNPETQSDDQGKFKMIVNPRLVKTGREYIILPNNPQNAVLGSNNAVLLFKLEGEPREINQGELSVLGARDLKALGINRLSLLLPKPN